MIWAIDPGNERSAFISLVENGELNPKDASYAIADNEWLLELMREGVEECDSVVIEMVASYGMPVGAEIFETVYWIGRFAEAATQKGAKVTRLPRIRVKQHICHDSRAKDANIRQALIDRFGEVGTKKNPGWFYGFKKDLWAAYALAVTFVETKEA